MTRPLLWAPAVAMALLMPHQSMGGANFSDTFGIASFWKSPGSIVVAAPQLPVGPAQAGVIAFMDGCTNRVYAIRGDGTGRVELPLPPLPGPATAFAYSPYLLDVTTSDPTTSPRPTTVVYRLAISRRDGSEPPSVALYAVQVNDAGTGELTPEPPVRLNLADVVAVNGATGVNPNHAFWGAFSSTGAEERLALVATTDTAYVLMTVKVDRDGSRSVTSLSDVVVVADLFSLVPDLGLANQGFTGSMDYAPDGSRIVAAINRNLWLVRLTSQHTLDAAEQLTSTDNVVEWNPSFSPDGLRVAYTGGPVLKDGTVRTTDLYTIAAFGGAVTRITSTARHGRTWSPDNAMWAAGGTSIGFAAYTSGTPRRATCSLVNREIFLISADGSGTASLITDTNGTSVEAVPKWGW